MSHHLRIGPSKCCSIGRASCHTSPLDSCTQCQRRSTDPPGTELVQTAYLGPLCCNTQRRQERGPARPRGSTRCCSCRKGYQTARQSHNTSQQSMSRSPGVGTPAACSGTCLWGSPQSHHQHSSSQVDTVAAHCSRWCSRHHQCHSSLVTPVWDPQNPGDSTPWNYRRARARWCELQTETTPMTPNRSTPHTHNKKQGTCARTATEESRWTGAAARCRRKRSGVAIASCRAVNAVTRQG